MLVVFNIIMFFGWGIATAALLWPFLGAPSLLVSGPIFAYPVYAWFNADKIVARQAEFRPPTELQKKYFEFLGIQETVWTHPSLAVAAGAVAGPKGKLFLLTAGLTRYLSDTEIQKLIKGMNFRDTPAIFRWTFHLATGGSMLFTVAPRRDFGSEWGRLMVLAGTVIGALTVSLLAIYIAALGGGLPAWLAVAVVLLPFFALVLWLIWSASIFFVSKMTAQKWNQTVWLGAIRLRPMQMPADGYQRLHLLAPGLVEAFDVPEKREVPEFAEDEILDQDVFMPPSDVLQDPLSSENPLGFGIGSGGL